MNPPTMITNVRRATIGELEILKARLLRKNRFAGDLENAIIFALENDGIVDGAFIARPMYEGELILFDSFTDHAPLSAVRRGIYRLARKMIDWIGSAENVSGARSIICNIEDVTFAELAKEFGFLHVYKTGIVVGVDTARPNIGKLPQT